MLCLYTICIVNNIYNNNNKGKKSYKFPLGKEILTSQK